MTKQTVGIGLIGIGGWAQTHIATLRTLNRTGVCRFIAAADPGRDRFPAVTAGLEADGVEVMLSSDDLLARDDIDAVVIATPIPLHTYQTVAALGAGKHVYLEKPPCATPAQLNRMEAARAESGKICAVGFQKQSQSSYGYAKSLIESGELGTITNIWSGVRWMRDDAYYNRSNWAGRLSIDGEATLDGPATNALSHIVQAGLSLTDPVARVRGRLRHARPIESYDASYIEADTVSGVNVRFMLAHATANNNQTVMHVLGTIGRIALNWNFDVSVTLHGEPTRVCSFPCLEWMGVMLDFLAAVENGGRPATTLMDTLSFVQALSGALQSGGTPGSFPIDLIDTAFTGTPEQVYTVRGLDDEMEAFALDSASVPSLLAPGPWIAAADIDACMPAV